ncbi:alpha/beta fold hydrolase [Enterococcus sp. BWB1-3]|uniref:alpha/beta hydrolase n=1 Tax=unclassified Enterococcus TaxID=2608891 RepID=UPI001924D707|nr:MULTISPECIES: alpha/beta fold hydrolase [unclassified Enterococcus]MBL1228059.1 alpha/beta fold hydrolase [Enterococcus sp. BWB1-3]MCB5951885.1 alpha/beta fold hydrolase [Enterococcus sp. BWT-B8]MCB5954081.1 alpha/beta fold hydrolase [Enterococcus sp. CWB-B31]
MPKPLFVEQGPKAILLLHAYSGSSNDVRMLCRYLEKENYTVYTPIFSGHATMAPEDILNKTVNDWENDTLQAVAFLKEHGYEQIAVLGLSMGGVFAVNLLTQTFDEIVGGGFFCSPIFPVKTHVPENFAVYAENVLKISGAEAEEIEKRMISIKQRAVQQLEQIEQYASATAENLGKISVPVFAAQAGQDEMIDAKGVFKTIEALTTTKLTFNWYPNSGHVLTVGPGHKELEQDVANFLETLPWDKENK